MIHQRLAPIAMEPRGVLARYFQEKKSSPSGRRRDSTPAAHPTRPDDRNPGEQAARDYA